MNSHAGILVLSLLLSFPAAARFRQYTVQRTDDVVKLQDASTQTTVSVMPSVGNVAFEMSVEGTNILRFPYASLDEFRKKPGLNAIPFLGPWANRLDEQAFYANGKKYALNMELGNVRGNHPIHGFLSSVPWQIVETKADAQGAWVTSRLEYYKQPTWMAQFPFAHTIDMTYRLANGMLEVRTLIHNLSAEAMPVSIGYHPYFQLGDSQRDDWTISIAARTQWVLSPDKLPTGETKPIEGTFPNPEQIRLRDFDLDHVFDDLIRDGQGHAAMVVKGRSQKIEVLFGPNYRAAVIYAPSPSGGPNRNFICFEPMAGVTNAMNLAHKGLYKELQSIPPGGTWQESWWIRPSGF
jgi:aldose 1-epimerase